MELQIYRHYYRTLFLKGLKFRNSRIRYENLNSITVSDNIMCWTYWTEFAHLESHFFIWVPWILESFSTVYNVVRIRLALTWNLCYLSVQFTVDFETAWLFLGLLDGIHAWLRHRSIWRLISLLLLRVSLYFAEQDSSLKVSASEMETLIPGMCRTSSPVRFPVGQIFQQMIAFIYQHHHHLFESSFVNIVYYFRHLFQSKSLLCFS